MRISRTIQHGLAGLALLGGGAGWSAPVDEAGLTMALTGDSIITQRLSPYREPEFLRMIELIRGADVAFTNVEMLFHDYEGHPMASSGGTYMRAEPELAKELTWAGFDLGGLANNHTGDFSVEALQATDRALRAAGLVHAGTGDNLQQAREARYVDTPKGRIALVSCASTFTPHSVAGTQRADLRGRPGLSPLGFDTKYVVDQATIDALRALSGKLSASGRTRDGEREKTDEVMFHGNRYVAGDTFQMVRTVKPDDLAQIVASIKDAKTMAEHVIVSVHCHESGSPRGAPADFLVTFARAAIDAGASVVVGHGPHTLKGIELYKGKPIFYSLGDFIFQNDTVLRLPAENYARFGLPNDARISDFNAKRYRNDTSGFPAQREIWESVVATPRFQGERLVELRLHPISLGFGKPSGKRGRPMLADPELAKKIIDDLARLSEPMGTKIEFRDGMGVVALDSAVAAQ